MYGETDLIVTLFTETEGKLGGRLRGGRRSSRRAAGGVEPFHTLEVTLDDKGSELLTLKEVRFVTVRARLVADLDAMEAAGTALRWARYLLPVRHAEPAAWSTLERLLGELDKGGRPPRGVLALAGFHLLASVGYALELERCIVCGRPCPQRAPAFVDASRGGLVCRACGGTGRLLDGLTRELAARAQRAPDDGEDWLAPAVGVSAEQTEELLSLLSAAMAVHTGLDSA